MRIKLRRISLLSAHISLTFVRAYRIRRSSRLRLTVDEAAIFIPKTTAVNDGDYPKLCVNLLCDVE